MSFCHKRISTWRGRVKRRHLKRSNDHYKKANAILPRRILKTSTEITEFQKRRCPQSNNTKADRYQGGLQREQRLIRAMGIEILQSQKNHSGDPNAPITNSHGATHMPSRHHRLTNASSKWSKRSFSHQSDNIVRQTINKAITESQ